MPLPVIIGRGRVVPGYAVKDMIRYIIWRLVSLIPVVLLISLVVFVLMALIPGNPATIIAGVEATPEMLAAVTQRLGLDQPLPVRYLLWLRQVAGGDLGTSILTKQPTMSMLSHALVVTAELAFLSITLAVLIAVPVGIVAAIKRRQLVERGLMALTLLAISLPTFWTGLMMILVFAVWLKILPASGFVPMSESLGENMRSMFLPTLSLGTFLAGPLTRMVRSGMLEVLGQEYVRTARAKGLTEWAVICRHVLRNMLIPVITFLGLQLGSVLGGAIITEEVFGLPGLGRLAVGATLNRDYPLIQGCMMVAALAYALPNLLVDILYVLLDPRVRLVGKALMR
jgi:peptide/nickel transport system permease protein